MRWALKNSTLRKGFTIVELLIVIAIIALLTTIILVGYGTVIGAANDSSVKSDLQKIDDAMKQYALDSGGSFPDIAEELQDLGLKLSPGAYYTGDKSNVYFCLNSGRTEFAVVAKSRSGKRFVVKSEEGLTEYTGSVVWDANTINGWDTCADVDPTYLYIGVAAMNSAEWSSWAGTDAAVGSVTNLVVNPSLTTLTTYAGAGAAGTSAVITSGGFAGDSFMRRTFTGAGNGGIFLGNPSINRISVSGNDTYTASGYVRASATKSMRIVIGWYASGSSVGSTNGTTVTVGTDWRRLILTAQAPATADEAVIGFYVDGTDWVIGEYLDLDAVMFTFSTTLYNYADGDLDGWSWTGTPDGSTSQGPTP